MSPDLQKMQPSKQSKPGQIPLPSSAEKRQEHKHKQKLREKIQDFEKNMKDVLHVDDVKVEKVQHFVMDK